MDQTNEKIVHARDIAMSRQPTHRTLLLFLVDWYIIFLSLFFFNHFYFYLNDDEMKAASINKWEWFQFCLWDILFLIHGLWTKNMFIEGNRRNPFVIGNFSEIRFISG